MAARRRGLPINAFSTRRPPAHRGSPTSHDHVAREDAGGAPRGRLRTACGLPHRRVARQDRRPTRRRGVHRLDQRHLAGSARRHGRSVSPPARMHRDLHIGHGAPIAASPRRSSRPVPRAASAGLRPLDTTRARPSPIIQTRCAPTRDGLESRTGRSLATARGVDSTIGNRRSSQRLSLTRGPGQSAAPSVSCPSRARADRKGERAPDATPGAPLARLGG